MNISFIIPAYNASSTILRTLDSIYSLSLKIDEFEVIVIDDCSTDNTLQIIQNYGGSKSNMRVLHQQKNHRQGAARNWGVREARGDYVMFVDADDKVEKAVPLLLKRAFELSLDTLTCDYDVTYQNEIEHRTMPIEYEGMVLNGRVFMEQVYDVIFNYCSSYSTFYLFF